jgi:hypothetical protein
MKLALQGHPLHSRGLSVTLVQREDRKLDVFGELVDLRKRGFVPVCGNLHAAGLLHHMQLRGVVDPENLTLESLEGAQPVVAFEPSEVDGGESCRDPIHRLRGLSGATLDASFARNLASEFGGPLGCSHLLVLAQLLGTTTQRAIELERERFGSGRPFAAGERVFRRDLIVDGTELTKLEMQLALQLSDLHLAPVSGIVRPMERFAGQLEVRALATVDLRKVELSAIGASERERTIEDLKTAEWRDRSADVESLVGLRLASGVGAELIRNLGERPGDRPLLDALLQLTPGMHQCMAVMNEGWNLSTKVISTVTGMNGIPDTCYMWRTGGALDRLRSSSAEPDVANAD